MKIPFLDPDYIARTVNPDEHARTFVCGYLEALGARTEWVHPTLLRSELTRDQLCEMEHRPLRTWYAANNVPDLTTLYLWLDHRSAPTDERAEAGTPASWRFEMIQRSVQRIGSVTRLRLVPQHSPTNTAYVPILCFGFEVSLRCFRRIDQLVPVAVDLVNGTFGEEFARRILCSHLDDAYVPPSQVRRRELRFKHAFEIACECVKERLTQDSAVWDWYYRAVYRLNNELEQVDAYFAQRRRDGETELEAEQEQALDEVRRRFAPRIEARTALAALVLCPEDELP